MSTQKQQVHPLFTIDENATPLPADFTWNKDWVAVRMWKEQRDDGEFYFACCQRKYGPNDWGNTKDDFIYIGRQIDWIKERTTDVNPKSKTFGQRIDAEAETVTISEYNEKTQDYEAVQKPVNSRKIYRYMHKSTDKNISAKYESLYGQNQRGGRTELTFVWGNGSNFAQVKTKKEFFGKNVQDMIDYVESKQQTEAFKTTPSSA